jgi:hypothetical protein
VNISDVLKDSNHISEEKARQVAGKYMYRVYFELECSSGVSIKYEAK